MLNLVGWHSGLRELFTNNYTVHIFPPPIQQFIWRVCNHYLHQRVPEKWLEPNIILLFKKGDVTNPVNYRPEAVPRTYGPWPGGL